MNDSRVPDTRLSEGLVTQAGRAVSAAFTIGVLIVVMWGLEFADYMMSGELDHYGIQARNVDDLPQIFSAPFLHGGFGHLMANTVPFAVLGFLAAVRGFAKFVAANLLIIVVGGLGIWFIAPPGSETLGASILVFGYFGYLVGRGLFERHLADIAIALVVVVLYGTTMLLGLVPGDQGISWQGHLFGLVGGIVAAWVLRRRRG
ncbi:rhomboid family intramembrane serine protease [Actinomadura craniellae]|uniref:Rhomboid family intramembrane serine protease n=1 Tax=Actinomadura craniellae TaxID=2231787 RepID=A0A365H3D0_9ACTN|nr:rhomboid family intramembrane serine protease [Actinomadura craniellae]RAY13614.1 rhomboid family intramembrane serine protease [Actinomadura craniellae]